MSNSRRQGDRVVCRLGGFAKGSQGGINKVLVTDLSIGGLGFLSETQIPIGEEIVITLPLGQAWTQIALDCKVVHSEKSPGGGSMPWLGGLVFKNVKIQDLQILVEFLARIGTPTEHDTLQAAA